MADGQNQGISLETDYLGFKLKNPLIVASSPLTSSVATLQKAQEAGVAAVVLKSIFEEQIENSLPQVSPEDHPEALDYLESLGRSLGPREYLDLISSAKKSLEIPVMGSLNCRNEGTWKNYALQMEKAGADALELNLSPLALVPATTGMEIEEKLLRMVESVTSVLKIPVAVKLAPYYSALPRLVRQLGDRGARAVVLFNRYYSPDINLDNLKRITGNRYSSPAELADTLRWTALLAPQSHLDICGSRGVHGHEDALKLILSGAKAVQLCSTLIQKGWGQVAVILQGMEKWLADKHYPDLASVRGLMSRTEGEDASLLERQQYIKALVGQD